MLIKVHNSYRQVVALCDKELLGKTFEDDVSRIEIKDHFFNGEEKTPEQVAEILTFHAAEDATFNIVGEKSINIALKLGLIQPEGVRRIQEIPIALSLL